MGEEPSGTIPASMTRRAAKRLRGRERRPLRRSLAFGTFLLLTAAAGARPASAGSIDLRVGGFFPRGCGCGTPGDPKGSLFLDDAALYTVNPKKDFDGLYGGIEYSM